MDRKHVGLPTIDFFGGKAPLLADPHLMIIQWRTTCQVEETYTGVQALDRFKERQ